MKRLNVIIMAVLAACQPSNAQNIDKDEKSAVNIQSEQTHPDCEEMPWNSSKSNCEAFYDANDAFDEIQPVYQSLLKKMDAPDREWAKKKWYEPTEPELTYREALIQSQLAWLKYSEAQCLIESYEWRGGVSQPQRHANCSLQLNRERLAQLKRMQEEY